MVPKPHCGTLKLRPDGLSLRRNWSAEVSIISSVGKKNLLETKVFTGIRSAFRTECAGIQNGPISGLQRILRGRW